MFFTPNKCWWFKTSYPKSYRSIYIFKQRYSLIYLTFCKKLLSSLITRILDVSIRMVSWKRATNLPLSHKYASTTTHKSTLLCSCKKTSSLQLSTTLSTKEWRSPFDSSLKNSKCFLRRQIKEKYVLQKTTGMAYTKKVNPRLVPQPDSR